MVNAPFPASLTTKLLDVITGIVPRIPLVNVPTTFSLPETNYAENEVSLELSGIDINEKEISMEFQIGESPRS